MPNNFFMVGKSIKLELNHTSSYLSLEGIIEKIDSDVFIVRIDGEYVQKQPQPVKCTISNGTKTRVCLFRAVIQHGSENKLFLTTPSKENIKIDQRRAYIRVPIHREVNCYLIGINDKKIESDKIFPGIIKDISGGGVLLSSNLSIPIGTILVFEIELDHSQYLLTIKVLRHLKSEDSGTIDYGCKFIGIDDGHRQKIIAFCNKEQLILQRRNRSIV